MFERRNPRRSDLPDTLMEMDDEMLVTLYEEFGWSTGDIAECLEEGDKTVNRRLHHLGVDTTERNRTPVRGSAQTLWETCPDEVDLSGGEA